MINIKNHQIREKKKMMHEEHSLERFLTNHPLSSYYLRRNKHLYPGAERTIQSADSGGDIIPQVPQGDGFEIAEVERFSGRQEENTYYYAWDFISEIIDKALAAERMEKSEISMRKAKRYFQEVWGLQQQFLNKGFAYFLEHDEMFRPMSDIPLVHPREVVQYVEACLLARQI